MCSMIYVIVGLAGMLGAVLRYLLSMLALPAGSGDFPAGTLLVNLAGAFILGWFTAMSARSSATALPEWFRTAFGTGLIGSFTTFSTLSVETVQLLQHNEWMKAAVYALSSLIGGLLLAWLGWKSIYKPSAPAEREG